MKTRSQLILFVAALLMSTGISAQKLYSPDGRYIAKISDNEIWDASLARVVARINGERITDYGGNTLNYIKSDGRVLDKTGSNRVGWINNGGRIVRDGHDVILGFVEDTRNVYDKSQKKMGWYEGVDPVYVAYYYFFFPGKNKAVPSANSSGSGSGSNGTKQSEGNVKAAQPKVKTTNIYDRDRKLMGTLYGTDYFISSTKNGIRYDFKKTNEGLTILRQGTYLAHVGKDNKTVYTKHGEAVYGIVDENGNAYLDSGEQYGVIKKDGMVYATKSLDMPFGYVSSQDFDRHTVGLIYFVCYYGILHNYYKEVDSKKTSN